jgi:hypothetical protein
VTKSLGEGLAGGGGERGGGVGELGEDELLAPPASLKWT